MLSVIEGYFHT